ncbi:MAG: four helix bundle protein [Flavobacteriales bacterium]|nr:four helix bundle protein [Flavobacteriales bacterium]
MKERKNINRGFEKLRVWNEAVNVYVATCDIFKDSPFELKKIASNAIDAAQSISRNIAEGYCRKGIKEYLQFLNIALASSGELHSCLLSSFRAQQITEQQYEHIDQIHYKMENQLIKLIESIQMKMKKKDWDSSFAK